MAKIKTRFVCQDCGTSSPKWMGRCAGCGTWNSLVEEVSSRTTGHSAQSTLTSSISSLASDDADAEDSRPRISTGNTELDRVLGGGLVSDSFVLIGGDPGIGKSTLLLQLLEGLCSQSIRVLYASGEESVSQLKSRAHRLGVARHENGYLISENRFEAVFEHVEQLAPRVLIIDSLQTFVSSAIESAAGSVGQVREIASKLMHLAKGRGIAVLLVGHVTKDGALAGPKVVEHLVDTVLYFEGEQGLSHRILRTVKNRFGSSHELGVFEMDSNGLRSVENAAGYFLETGRAGAPGTAISSIKEGSRGLFVEIQSLLSPSAFQYPKRSAVGYDLHRIHMLTAVLQRHCGANLQTMDIYVNVVGGLRIQEPTVDLALVSSILSCQLDRVIPSSTLFLGELGLTGEVRRTPDAERRIEEACQLGFERVVLSKSTVQALTRKFPIQLCSLSHVEELRQLV